MNTSQYLSIYTGPEIDAGITITTRQSTLNITEIVPPAVGTYYTLSTAVSAVPVDNRFKGAQIRFQISISSWENWEFKDDNVVTNWDTTSFWEQIITGTNVGQTYEVGGVPKGEIFNDYTVNVASGEYSHAEGANTEAIGQYSHAEGFQTKANSSYSHAEGEGTIISSINGHVQGKFNVDDNTKIHIVGNGIDDSSRENIHTVDFDGNFFYKGIGTVPDMLVDGKSVATELDTLIADVTERILAIRSANLVITSEAILPFTQAETIYENGLTVNTVGSIVCQTAGFYKGNLKIYVNEIGDPDFKVWVELKTPGGSWTLLNSSLSIVKVKDDTSFLTSLEGGVNLAVGDEIRIKVKADSGTITFETVTETVSLGTVTQYGASLMMYKIGN